MAYEDEYRKTRASHLLWIIITNNMIGKFTDPKLTVNIGKQTQVRLAHSEQLACQWLKGLPQVLWLTMLPHQLSSMMGDNA